MSKLDDIFTNQVINEEPYLRKDWYKAKQQIKDLMLELIGEEMHYSHLHPQNNRECIEFDGRNKFRNAIRQKVEEL